MADIKVGDEVRILNRARNSYGSFPKGGYTGTVTKVARRYATATYIRQRTARPAGPVEETVEFDMETGKLRDGTDYSSNYGLYVRTAEQYEAEQRRNAAIAAIRERGVSLEFTRHSFTTEQIEALAEVVKTWED